jgi:hypothetical protein
MKFQVALSCIFVPTCCSVSVSLALQYQRSADKEIRSPTCLQQTNYVLLKENSANDPCSVLVIHVALGVFAPFVCHKAKQISL